MRLTLKPESLIIALSKQRDKSIMKNSLSLVQKVSEKFNGKIVSCDTVMFNVGDDTYCLTDGTIYATLDDGTFLPGFKKVKSLRSVSSFVSLRS